MKTIKKQMLWLMVLMMACIQIQPTDHENKPYFAKLGAYINSEACMSQMFDFAGKVGFTFIAAYIYMYVQQHTKDTIGNQTMQIYYPGDITTKLTDVAGLAGAKADMQDIISYLKSSKKYKKIGAKIPHGILMNGAPGNGKTLLAKAVAGEVNCPFISISGASFVQMYAGLGAARVRDLFNLAQKLSKHYGGCIIFIDEIDAVAHKRSASGVGIEREHDQTVAQLLECMDGLQKSEHPIIVLGATNRAELLDPAIVRPGRFDRKVDIQNPLVQDRIALIQLALKNVIYNQDIDINRLARITSGFSGAELTGLINDAAILAVTDNKKSIRIDDIELAFDHIVLGREVKGMDQTDTDKWLTSIHEAGHAAGWLFGNNSKYIVHKASIIPRSHTLGIVWATMLHESYAATEDEMKSKIVVFLCGGLAEQEFGFGKSTGMSNDLAKATTIAYDMVIKYGMSDNFNYMSCGGLKGSLPTDIASPTYKAAAIIVDECLVIAKKLVADHKNDIEKIAKLLLQKGTVLGDEIYQVVGLPVPTIE